MCCVQPFRVVFIFCSLLCLFGFVSPVTAKSIASEITETKSDKSSLIAQPKQATPTKKPTVFKQPVPSKKPLISNKSGKKTVSKTAGKQISTSSKTGYCCVKGGLKTASQLECKRQKGSYYSSLRSAQKVCKQQRGYCCAAGEISIGDKGQCSKKKGMFFSRKGDAQRRCKQQTGYCLFDTSIKKISKGVCEQKRGEFFLQERIAKQNLAKKSGFCLQEGKIMRMSYGNCSRKKGQFFLKQIEAEKVSRSEKGYCCKKGMVMTSSRGKCNGKGSAFSLDRIQLAKTCSDSRPDAKIRAVRQIRKPTESPVSSTGPSLRKITSQMAAKPARVSRKPFPGSLQQSTSRSALAAVAVTQRVDGKVDTGIATQPQEDVGSRVLLEMAVQSAGPDWTTVSGMVTGNSTEASSHITGVSARRVNNVAGGLNHVSANIGSEDAIYSLQLPPNSNWVIQPDIDDPFLVQGIVPAEISTPGAFSVINRDFVVTMAENWEEFSTCAVSGTVFVDDALATEPLKIEVASLGSQPVSMPSISIANGNYSVDVQGAVGGTQYSIQPLFVNGAHDGATLDAQTINCVPGFSQDITGIDFHYTSPQMCMLSGRVRNNGRWAGYGTLESLILQRLDGDYPPQVVPVAGDGGTYQVEIAQKARYSIAATIPGGRPEYQAPAPIVFETYQGQVEHQVTIELEFPEFLVGNLVVKRAEEYYLILSLQTLLRDVDNGAYQRSVILSSSSHWMRKTCEFRAEGECEFRYPLDKLDLANDSLRAEIEQFTNEPNSGRTYPELLSNIDGDLASAGGGEMGVTVGEYADLKLPIVNNGPNESTPCRVSVQLNQLSPQWFPIPALAKGEIYTVENRFMGAINVGGTISIQIDNSCDRLRGNNKQEITITEEMVESRSQTQTGGESLAEEFWHWLWN